MCLSVYEPSRGIIISFVHVHLENIVSHLPACFHLTEMCRVTDTRVKKMLMFLLSTTFVINVEYFFYCCILPFFFGFPYQNTIFFSLFILFLNEWCLNFYEYATLSIGIGVLASIVLSLLFLTNLFSIFCYFLQVFLRQV